MVLEIWWWPRHLGDLDSISGSATDVPNDSRQMTSTHLPSCTEQMQDSHSRSRKLSLRSTCIPHISSTVMAFLLPLDLSYNKLQLTSLLLTCQHAVSGYRVPKQEGGFSAICHNCQKHLPQLCTSQGLMCSGKLPSSDILQQLRALCVHLHVSLRDVGTQEVHFHLGASILPPTTSTDTKNCLA